MSVVKVIEKVEAGFSNPHPDPETQPLSLSSLQSCVQIQL